MSKSTKIPTRIRTLLIHHLIKVDIKIKVRIDTQLTGIAI